MSRAPFDRRHQELGGRAVVTGRAPESTQTAMHASTTVAVTGTAQPSRSDSSMADHVIARNGWTRLSCPIRAVPPTASARYQTTEPRNMLATPA